MMDPIYRSELNRDVVPAQADEFVPLRLGQLEVWPPVVLGPMAGVTNYPFRELCRRFGAGLCVSEMVMARALIERHDKTLKLADFGPDEAPRSLQLYGANPYHVGEAARQLVGEGCVDHIDLNFGCPVRKVTRKGGGAALPLKPGLLEKITRAAVTNAEQVPVTIKVRIGIDEQLVTFLTAGRIAESVGCAAVGLHARTAAQLYDGSARWEAITELKQAVSIPVLGNGDIWEAEDALRMMRQTGCDGVIVMGGTGVSARDRTHEALAALLDKRLDGFGELFRALSYERIGSAAMLSRAVGGIAAGRLLFSLPGATPAVELALEKLILPELGHLLSELKKH